jgi:hypothetical protein
MGRNAEETFSQSKSHMWALDDMFVPPSPHHPQELRTGKRTDDAQVIRPRTDCERVIRKSDHACLHETRPATSHRRFISGTKHDVTKQFNLRLVE